MPAPQTTQQVEYVRNSEDLIKMAMQTMEEAEQAMMELQREHEALKAVVVAFVKTADKVHAAKTELEGQMAASLLVHQVLAAARDLDVPGPEEERVCGTCDGSRRVYDYDREARCPDCSEEG